VLNSEHDDFLWTDIDTARGLVHWDSIRDVLSELSNESQDLYPSAGRRALQVELWRRSELAAGQRDGVRLRGDVVRPTPESPAAVHERRHPYQHIALLDQTDHDHVVTRADVLDALAHRIRNRVIRQDR